MCETHITTVYYLQLSLTRFINLHSSHSLSSAYYGIINEYQFQQIYAQFFPYGGKLNLSYYRKIIINIDRVPKYHINEDHYM